MGPRIPGKAGRAAESVTGPQSRKPILTYVLPVGAPSEQLVLARLEETPPDAAADAGQAKPPDPDATPPPGANRPVLDFYLSHAKLGRRGDKVRSVPDRRELPQNTDWNP